MPVSSTADSAPHSAPAPTAARQEATMTRGPGPGRYNATSVPARPPSTICPSPPRLKTPARNAIASAMAMPMIGVARSTVLTRPRPVSEPSIMEG